MFTPQKIAEITNGQWIRKPRQNSPLFGGAFNTKEIDGEEIFFAWKGEKKDAHEFLRQITPKSIRLIIAEHERFPFPESEKIAVLKVPDSLQALHQIAKERASDYPGKIIAVTGSSGKTTTKNWLAKVLSSKFSVHFSPRSFNNHIGCPISLLSLKQETDVCILEMGTSGVGEIETLTQIARPHYSILLNVGHAHIGKFGDYETIVRAKSEIFTHQRPPGVAFLSQSLSKFKIIPENKTIFFGTGAEKYSPEEHSVGALKRHFRFRLKQNRLEFETDLVGEHVGENLAAVLAVAEEMEMNPDEILAGLDLTENLPGRGNLIEGQNNSRIFDDAYNANPESILNFFKTIDSIPSEKKIAVIGTLGEQDPELKYCRSVLANQIPPSIDFFLLTGETSEKFRKILLDFDVPPQKIFLCPGKSSLLKKTRSFLCPGNLIGVKASRSSKLESLIEKIRTSPGQKIYAS